MWKPNVRLLWLFLFSTATRIAVRLDQILGNSLLELKLNTRWHYWVMCSVLHSLLAKRLVSSIA